MEMLTSIGVTGIRIINKFDFNVISKTIMTNCLEVSIKACLFMILIPETFPIIILIIIPPVSEFIISWTIILYTTYLTRQKVDLKLLFPSPTSLYYTG